MKLIEVRPELHMLLLEFGQAYLWNDAGSLTLIDTGIAGSGDDIADALSRLGFHRSDVRQIVLTHFHEDHSGGAAEISAWGDVTVMAHRLEAPVIRGDVQGPPPNFTDEERALHRSIGGHLLPPAPAARVDRELDDGDLIDFGGGAHVIATPGHTDGSIGLYVPRSGVLFTGDTVAHIEGRVIPGVFNLDRAEMLRSFRRLTRVDAHVACVGHGEPVMADAQAALSAVAADFPV